jgi:hypothetical protein
VSIDLSNAGVPSVHDNILPATVQPGTSLTGSAYNTPTPANANDPGLDSVSRSPFQSGVTNMKSHHWVMIGVIVLVLLGLWYYFGGQGTAAA